MFEQRGRREEERAEDHRVGRNGERLVTGEHPFCQDPVNSAAEGGHEHEGVPARDGPLPEKVSPRSASTAPTPAKVSRTPHVWRAVRRSFLRPVREHAPQRHCRKEQGAARRLGHAKAGVEGYGEDREKDGPQKDEVRDVFPRDAQEIARTNEQEEQKQKAALPEPQECERQWRDVPDGYPYRDYGGPEEDRRYQAPALAVNSRRIVCTLCLLKRIPAGRAPASPAAAGCYK